MSKIIKNVKITCYSDLEKQNLIDLVESGTFYSTIIKNIITIKASNLTEWIPYSKFFQKIFESYRDYCVSNGSIDIEVKTK